MFVCLNPFYSLLLPPCCGIGRGLLLQKFQCKQNLKSFILKSTEGTWGVWSSNFLFKQGYLVIERTDQILMCFVAQHTCERAVYLFGIHLSWNANHTEGDKSEQDEIWII